MILSDQGIRAALENKELEIDPLPSADHYSPSAVDLIVGDASTFRRWKTEVIGAKGTKILLDISEQDYHTTAKNHTETVKPENDGKIVLPPYAVVPQVMLCQTLQTVHLTPSSKLAARVEGKSTGARYGLMVHMTAPTIHNTFFGSITLEMVNHGPFWLVLTPKKTRICQLIIEKLDTPAAKVLESAFMGQKDPLGVATTPKS